ncbi:hypothetical protein, partial [Sphingomonas sp.]|uniref:hypothetical protein n=1 Tax=Sphingomonas sp. TaxID=28214 RepID=UPI003B3B4FB3
MMRNYRRFKRMLSADFMVYLRASGKKSLPRQISEIYRLYRTYDHLPYQYLKHGLYLRKFENGIERYLPTELLHITRDAANVRDFALSADGLVLHYSVGASREDVARAEQGEHDSGIHIDRTVPLGQSLFRGAHHEGRLATQRLYDHGGLYYLPLLSDARDRWKMVELPLATGAPRFTDEGPARALTASDLMPDFAGAWKLSEDLGSGRIAMLTKAGAHDGLGERPYAELAVLPSRGAQRAVVCVAAACRNKRITDIVWRRGHDEVVFTVTDRESGHGQSIFRWNVLSGQVQPVAESHGQLGGGGRWLTAPGPCAASKDALVCVAA